MLLFFISRWEDHIRHQEKLVVLGYMLNVAGFAGYLLVRNPIDLFIVQVIFGVGNAINVPAYNGLYSKHMDRGKFASEWGLWESTNYILLAGAAFVGGYLANVYGFQMIFIIMLAFSIAGLFVSARLLARRHSAGWVHQLQHPFNPK